MAALSSLVNESDLAMNRNSARGEAVDAVRDLDLAGFHHFHENRLGRTQFRGNGSRILGDCVVQQRTLHCSGVLDRWFNRVYNGTDVTGDAAALNRGRYRATLLMPQHKN